jgi:CRP-like cAMP-binding protein
MYLVNDLKTNLEQRVPHVQRIQKQIQRRLEQVRERRSATRTTALVAQLQNFLFELVVTPLFAIAFSFQFLESGFIFIAWVTNK